MTRTTLTLTFVALLVLTTSGEQAAPGSVTSSGDWTADSRSWWSSDDGPRLQLNLRTDTSSNWGSACAREISKACQMRRYRGLPRTSVSQ